MSCDGEAMRELDTTLFSYQRTLPKIGKKKRLWNFFLFYFLVLNVVVSDDFFFFPSGTVEPEGLKSLPPLLPWNTIFFPLAANSHYFIHEPIHQHFAYLFQPTSFLPHSIFFLFFSPLLFFSFYIQHIHWRTGIYLFISISICRSWERLSIYVYIYI